MMPPMLAGKESSSAERQGLSADEQEELESRSYELGFLLDPGLPAEEVAAAVTSQIRGAISERGGKPTVETQARSIRLAYSIKKVIQNKSHRFGEAYFGALKFEIAPLIVPELISAWRKSGQILRFLLVTSPIAKLQPKVAVKDGESKLKPEDPVVVGPAKLPMSEAEIDREIEELLAPAV